MNHMSFTEELALVHELMGDEAHNIAAAQRRLGRHQERAEWLALQIEIQRKAAEDARAEVDEIESAHERADAIMAVTHGNWAMSDAAHPAEVAAV